MKLIPLLLDEAETYIMLDALTLSERFHARSCRAQWQDSEDVQRIQQLQARLHSAMDEVEER